MYHILLMLVLLYFQRSFAKEFDLKIPGPERYDSKIAIVGAGPSGIHMAHLLKQKGFTNVTVFEKSSRIGGKSFTVPYRGGYNDMGGIYLTVSYRNNIMPLVRKYIPGEDIDIPMSARWTSGKPLHLSQYVMGQIMKRTNLKDTKHIRQRLSAAYKKYMRLHKLICGDYEFALMPKPCEAGMYLMRGTMEEFLKRNNMMVLAPIFELAHTIIGYGHINDTATLYFLTWMNRDFMTAVMGQTSSKDAGRIAFVLKKGTQRLWETIAKKDKLDVRFNIVIRRIRRVLGPEPAVWIKKKQKKGDWHWEKFDFLIWSPEMKVSLKLFDKVNPIESLFNRTTPTYWVTSITDIEHVKRSFSPRDIFMDNMQGRGEFDIWMQIDQYGMRHGQQGPAYLNGEFPTGNDTRKMRSTVTCQVGVKEANIGMYRKKLDEHFNNLGGKLISIRNMTVWRYFPRYTPKDIENGILWKILDIQGHFGMWYIGSSVSFESLRDVVEYNRLITKYMVLPASEQNTL